MPKPSPLGSQYKPWRLKVAEQIDRMFECGTSAARSAGLDPVQQIVDLLTREHRCVHDPIKEENVLRCTDYDD